MSSQLTTLDHAVMSVLLNAQDGVAIQTLVRLSKSRKARTMRCVEKLIDLGFVSRRGEDGAEPLFFAVLASHYFPPVSDVSGRAISFDEPELQALVAECDKQNLTH